MTPERLRTSPLVPDRSPPDPATVAHIATDPGALERFYRAHVNDVIGFVARRCPSAHDVADLTTDIFLTAIDAAAGYDPRRGRPIAWLLGIARNVLLRYLRTRATERRGIARLSGRRLLDPDDIQRLEERIDAERHAQRLLGDLDELTAREREVVELVDRAGLTIAEAARTLGLTAGVVRIRRHRAHTRLRAHSSRKDQTDADI